MTVNITPAQAAGTPTPESPLAISGWMAANVSRAEKNLMNPLMSQHTTISDGVFTNTNTVVNAVLNGANDLSTGGQFLRAGTYTFSYKPSSGPIWNRVIARYSDGTTERVSTPAQSGDYVVGTFTLEQDAYVLIRHSGAGASVFSEPQIEFGSSRTTYSPYSGTTYQVSWQSEAGTVYGGTLQDNGDGTWTLKARPYYASYAGEALIGPWVSSMDVYAEGAAPTTGAQVVDLGGAETEYTLSADSVRTLLGQNNVFADCGDVAALVYRADPTLFVGKKVAALTAAIAAVLPDNPSTDGSYVLTDTVSSGEATLSWEAGE